MESIRGVNCKFIRSESASRRGWQSQVLKDKQEFESKKKKEQSIIGRVSRMCNCVLVQGTTSRLTELRI